MTPRPARRASRAIGLAVALAVALAACGPDLPAGSPEPTAEPIATPTVTLYGLNETVWYAGLVLTFTTATAELDPRGGTVTVAGRFANPGADDRPFDIPLRLTAGAAAFDLSRGQVVPAIPGGGSVNVLLQFDVIGHGSVDDAVLRVGSSSDHQALVPLTAGTVPSVTLEPVTLDAHGTANAADLRLALTAGELRWDLPDWADELTNPLAVITLTYNVTYRGTFTGGFAFTGDNVALQLPDGTVVGPRRDGHSQSIQLIAAGQTATGLSSRFEIPSGTTGKFILLVRNGTAHPGIAFTVPG